MVGFGAIVNLVLSLLWYTWLSIEQETVIMDNKGYSSIDLEKAIAERAAIAERKKQVPVMPYLDDVICRRLQLALSMLNDPKKGTLILH